MARPFSRAALEADGPRCPAGFQFFYGHGESSGPVAVLSNWYVLPEPFIDANGNTFSTSEHYMMHAKAVLFEDFEIAAAILGAPSPGEAKKLGRKVRGFDDRVWHQHALLIVADGCELKFSQCQYARDVLLGTGDKILVEAAPRDRIWGIGMCKNNPDRLDPRRWRGENLLGEALMIARERLRDKERSVEARSSRRRMRRK